MVDTSCYRKSFIFTTITVTISVYVLYKREHPPGFGGNSISSPPIVIKSAAPVYILAKDHAYSNKTEISTNPKHSKSKKDQVNDEVKTAELLFLQTKSQKEPNPEENYCSSSEFLEAIQHGKWVMRKPGSGELEEVTSFLHDTRTKYFNMPATLQRPDGKCGGGNNLIGTTNGPHARASFRALCDPHGPAPCCATNQCINKTVAECTCPGCLDVRARTHANFGSWEVDNAKCKIPMWNDQKAVCDLLKGHTIHVMGDSYLAQIYLSLLYAVRGGESLLKPGITDSEKNSCKGERLYVATCRKEAVEAQHPNECDSTVSMKRFLYWNGRQPWRQVVKGLLGKPNSIIVYGIGLHDNFNFPFIRDKVIDPMLKLRGNNSWPRIVWFTPHVPGLLKSSGAYPAQTREHVLRYASQMMSHLKGKLHNVDSIAFTDGMVSYDGTHYGKAINDLKVRILLTLIDTNNKHGWNMSS